MQIELSALRWCKQTSKIIIFLRFLRHPMPGYYDFSANSIFWIFIIFNFISTSCYAMALINFIFNSKRSHWLYWQFVWINLWENNKYSLHSFCSFFYLSIFISFIWFTATIIAIFSCQTRNQIFNELTKSLSFYRLLFNKIQDTTLRTSPTTPWKKLSCYGPFQ